MVEEFMLLANIYTARRVLEEFPSCAVLRRHPSPPANNYDPLIKVALSKVSCFIFSVCYLHIILLGTLCENVPMSVSLV